MDNQFENNFNSDHQPGGSSTYHAQDGEAREVHQEQAQEGVQSAFQSQQQGHEETVQAGSLYSYSYVNREGEEQQRQFYTAYDAPKKKEKRKKEKKQREKKPQGFGVVLGKCAAVALVFGLVGGTVFYGTGYVFQRASGTDKAEEQEAPKNTAVNNSNKLTTTSTGTKAVVSDVSDVVDNVMPSIVSITNLSIQEMDFPFWFDETYSQEVPSAGSGIIVAQTDQELYIATNNHVVANAQTLTVSFADGEDVTAEIKGTDPSTDLAVISVPLDSIPTDTLNSIKVATLGDSKGLQVGEPAIAIGNALGYGQSVTTGVISALDREVTVTDSEGQPITNDLIQTDAAINPGNSGGALLNINGEVIGINSVKYSDEQVEGMGYAIPISVAEPIINDLITREAVDETEAAYLGVRGVSVTEEVSESYNMPRGIYLTEVVEGSAADKAGIHSGDILSSFDGRAVTSMEQLAERMQYYAAGTEVEIELNTAEGGAYVSRTIKVTLGKKIQ